MTKYDYLFVKVEKEGSQLDNGNFENEILELIERHAEGEYWDFKQQWHSNNADLLHDIICMANSPANRDCYIIIGIEDKTYNVLGVNDENRKNQQNVIDLLRQKPKWAGENIPEVYVKTIYIEDKEIDVVVVKQSNNTPFYLLKDYTNEGQPVFKGAIYTRRGDTNTSKTETANLYDTELLWKRRFGLLYNPSQRAKFYLKDIENWEAVECEKGKLKEEHTFFYYKPDPDYTVYFVYEDCILVDSALGYSKDINDERVGETSYYLFAFYNVSYHKHFSNNAKIILYYKDIPLYSNYIECIDEGKIKVVPPKFKSDSYYIKNSFQYLMFEFVFHHLCFGNSAEAKEMFMRVIPLYENEDEYNRFKCYISKEGFSRERFCDKTLFNEKMYGNAINRFKNTKICKYNSGDDNYLTEKKSTQSKQSDNLVYNFADGKNERYNEITRYLRIGKMLVDWLHEWRNIKE